MVKNKTHINGLTDVDLEFSLQIPQGHSVKIKFEQSQCNFYLNQKVVEQIQQAKKNGISLEVSTKLLIYLWYCSCLQHHFIPERRLGKKSNRITHSFWVFLLNIFKILRSKYLQNQVTLQIGFTFNSYYRSEKLAAYNYQEEDCILQSIVLFHGDVFQKIQESFLLYHPQNSIIISAHYWLIKQLLIALKKQLNLLVWELSSLLLAGLLVSKIELINNLKQIDRILIFIIAWLGTAIVIFVCRHFLSRLLKRSIGIKYQYIHFIAWLISCIVPAIAMIYMKDFQAINDTIFLVIAVCIPLLIQPILSFILPFLGKLILRRVMSSF